MIKKTRKPVFTVVFSTKYNKELNTQIPYDAVNYTDELMNKVKEFFAINNFEEPKIIKILNKDGHTLWKEGK